MSGSGVERRLAAILAADVAGYSRLMGADDEGTLAAFTRAFDEVFDPRIAEHKGRIVKTTGDGVLAEFPSVLEAVRCAVAVQHDMAARNADVPEDSRLCFRIGVNLGDVILDRDDIFGDGVNVAARLEEVAEPNGVAIAGSVYDQVRNRLDVGYQDLGALAMKNIAEPVRVYRLLLDGAAAGPAAQRWAASRRWPLAAGALAVLAVIGATAWLVVPRAPDTAPDAAAIEKMAYPLPEQPSIAVLPFDNLSGDPAQAHLGDGLTENIIASLSKLSKIFVIARNSVFTYRGRTVKVQKVAEDLGVRYVLSGGLQRSGDTLRITVQLVDAISGRQLWGERFDRPARDIFVLQDEITLNVIAALQVELTEGEMSRVRRRGTENLEAWLLVNQSLEAFQRLTKEDNVRAKELAERAIALDPNYADAYVRLARAHLTDYQAGWVPDRAAAFKRSVELVKKALTFDSAYADAYNLLGAIHLYVRRHDEALAYGEKAIALSPNYSIAKASLGMYQTYAGEPGKAIVTVQGAMRLSPYYPNWYLKELGRAYFQAGQYEFAVETLQHCLRRNPRDGEAQILLAAAYGAAGNDDKARTTVTAFLKDRPGYTLAQYAQGEFYRNPDDLKPLLDLLRTAGMPE